MTRELPTQPIEWKTSPEATQESLSVEDFLRAVDALKKADLRKNDRLSD